MRVCELGCVCVCVCVCARERERQIKIVVRQKYKFSHKQSIFYLNILLKAFTSKLISKTFFLILRNDGSFFFFELLVFEAHVTKFLILIFDHVNHMIQITTVLLSQLSVVNETDMITING